MSFITDLFGGGKQQAAAAEPIQIPDNGALVAERERQAQEAKDQAVKDRQQRARTGGMYSLFNQSTGPLGVPNGQSLGGTA